MKIFLIVCKRKLTLTTFKSLIKKIKNIVIRFQLVCSLLAVDFAKKTLPNAASDIFVRKNRSAKPLTDGLTKTSAPSSYFGKKNVPSSVGACP